MPLRIHTEYLSDGITETIISLTETGPAAWPRTAFLYKGKTTIRARWPRL
jgi:hypothetical protein